MAQTRPLFVAVSFLRLRMGPKRYSSLRTNGDDLLAAVVVHHAVRVARPRQAPGLPQRPQVAEAENRGFVEDLRSGIDDVSDPQGRPKVETTGCNSHP